MSKAIGEARLYLYYFIKYTELQIHQDIVLFSIVPKAARFRLIYISRFPIKIKHKRYSLSFLATKNISCDLLLHKNICNDRNKQRNRGYDFFILLQTSEL